MRSFAPPFSETGYKPPCLRQGFRLQRKRQTATTLGFRKTRGKFLPTLALKQLAMTRPPLPCKNVGRRKLGVDCNGRRPILGAIGARTARATDGLQAASVARPEF